MEMKKETDKAYCVELKKLVTIQEAEDEYGILTTKVRFNFLCADEQCRNQTKAVVAGVNYHKKPRERKHPQHFRYINPEKHSISCGVCFKVADEIIKPGEGRYCSRINSDEAMREAKEKGLKINDIIDVFVFNTSSDKVAFCCDSKDGNASVAKSQSGVSNKNKNRSKSTRTSSSFHELASTYNILLKNQLTGVFNLIFNDEKISYEDCFRPISSFNTLNNIPRVYSDEASLKVEDYGFFLNFGKRTIGGTIFENIYFQIIVEDIESDKNYAYILDSLNGKGNKARFRVSLLNPTFAENKKRPDLGYFRTKDFSFLHLIFLEDEGKDG